MGALDPPSDFRAKILSSTGFAPRVEVGQGRSKFVDLGRVAAWPRTHETWSGAALARAGGDGGLKLLMPVGPTPFALPRRPPAVDHVFVESKRAPRGRQRRACPRGNRERSPKCKSVTTKNCAVVENDTRIKNCTPCSLAASSLPEMTHWQGKARRCVFTAIHSHLDVVDKCPQERPAADAITLRIICGRNGLVLVDLAAIVRTTREA